MTTESKKLTSLDEYILLGKSGLRISPLCLGTMTFGQDWAFGNNSEECRKVFDLYREKGGNFFDTANNYTNGTSERYLGEYIQGVRSQVVVATKYTANPDSGAWLRGQPVPHPNPNGGGNHKKSLVENVDASLKRMGVDSVDLLYVHFWEYSTPVEQVMRNLDDVVRSGKAYHVAISDAPAWIISQANTIADFRGWSPFVGLQTRYNLIDRSFEFEFQPMVTSFGMSVMPWGCLAEGFLTGKHSKEKADEASGRKESVQNHFNDEKNIKTLEQVVKISQEVGKSPAAVSLNWMLQKKGISSPIIGARNVQQLEDNLSALEFTLTAEQMKALDEVSTPIAVPFPNNMASRLSGFADAGCKVRRTPLH